jgi:hypothetical protein
VAEPEPVLADPEPVVADPEPVVADPEPVVAVTAEPAAAAPEPILEESPVRHEDPPPDASMAAPAPPAPPRLQSVAMEERSDGLTAVVSLANGRQGARSIGFDTADLDGAVVAAFTEAAGRSIELLAVEWMQIPDGSVVTVVVRQETGLMTAGAAVMRSGRAFAVAAAARAALDT